MSRYGVRSATAGDWFEVVDLTDGSIQHTFRSLRRAEADAARLDRANLELVAQKIADHARTHGLTGRYSCPSYDFVTGEYTGDRVSPSYVPRDESRSCTPLMTLSGARCSRVSHIITQLSAARQRALPADVTDGT